MYSESPPSTVAPKACDCSSLLGFPSSHLVNIIRYFNIYKIIYAIGVTIIKLNTLLSKHIITKSFIRIGISVDRILGTLAEKNIIVDTEVTAIINLVINGASTTTNEGKNISVIPMAAPFAAKKESGI